MNFHGARWTGGDACTAGDTFFIVEQNHAGFRIDAESPGRADSDARSAAGAFFFIARHVLAERLDFNTAFYKEIDAFIVFFLLAFKLENQKSFLFGSNRCFKDVELKVKILDQAVYNRPIYKTLWEA